MICHRLEHTLYVLILSLVELLYLPRLVCVRVEFNGTTTIALSRRVGRDKSNLILVLVRRRQLVWVVLARISGRSLIFEVIHSMRGVARYGVVFFGAGCKGLESCRRAGLRRMKVLNRSMISRSRML